MSQGDSHRSDHSAGAAGPAGGWRVSVVRRLMALGGVVVVALGLVACNDAQAEPEPEPESPETTEVAPEPEPDPADDEPDEDETPGPQDYEHPEPGPDIDDDGQAGAEAAAVYFMELFSYAYATGDLEGWDEISADDCEFCAVVRDQVSDTYEDGGFVETEPPIIRSTSSEVWASSPGDFVVNLTIALEESRHFDADGRLDETFPSAEVQSLVLVEREEGSWVVLEAEAEDL